MRNAEQMGIVTKRLVIQRMERMLEQVRHGHKRITAAVIPGLIAAETATVGMKTIIKTLMGKHVQGVVQIDTAINK